MPSFGNASVTLLAFIVCLSIIVFVHEFGHYYIGKISGIKAEVFSVGFENAIALAFYRVMFRHPWKLQLGKVFVLPVAYGAVKTCLASLRYF